MKKILGILGLLIFVCSLTAFMNPNFLGATNLFNTLRWTSLFGIISIGVAFVIITGGIDLSVGSTIGLVGTTLAYLLTVKHVSTPLAILMVLGLSLLIGLFHGLLITKAKLQPFIVTLCGLLLYRGAARFISNDQSLGFGSALTGHRQSSDHRLGHPSSAAPDHDRHRHHRRRVPASHHLRTLPPRDRSQ